VSTPFLPRLELARRDTPIQHLERLEQELDLPGELWIKRDDMTGCALSGNKVRKLEYLLAEARAAGATRLVTCGGIQSNHCRATAIAGAQLGMGTSLVLRGEEPADGALGNLALDRLVGAELRWVTEDEYRNSRLDIMEEEAARWRAQGATVYVIPEGGSNALGAVGYVDCVREIQRWSGPSFDVLCHAVGSGGTSAGILAGTQIHGAEFSVLGFPVCDSSDFFREIVGDIIDEMAARYRFGLSTEGIEFEDHYKGTGYAEMSATEEEFLGLVARREGIILDPAYTCKALRGTCEEMKSGRFGKNPRVLFLHTGGLFGTLGRHWDP